MKSSLYYLSLGFTDDTSVLVSRAIRGVTGGPSHAVVLVLEVTPSGRHERYYFESLMKVDKTTHKDGVRGPIPWTNLSTWLDEKKSRTLVTVPEVGYLPLDQDEARAAVEKLRDAVNTVHYAKLQLAGNMLAAVAKLRVTFGEGSPLRWTCCEVPIRCDVFPSRWAHLVGLKDVNADEFWPGGPSRYSLMAAAQRVVRAYGTIGI